MLGVIPPDGDDLGGRLFLKEVVNLQTGAILHAGALSAAIVDQPQAAEAAQQTKTRSIELMENFWIGAIDGVVQEAVELGCQHHIGHEDPQDQRQDLEVAALHRLGVGHLGRIDADRGEDLKIAIGLDDEIVECPTGVDGHVAGGIGA